MRSSALSIERIAPWRVLVRHEWRLTVRDLRRAKRPVGPGGVALPPAGRGGTIALVVGAAIVLHGFGAVALAAPRHWSDSPVNRIAAAAALGFLFTLMLSTAMSRIVAAFHERRDLDLLLGAPIAPDLLLAIRASTIVAAVSVLFVIFVYPVVDVGVASGRWWMARLYLVVPLFAMLATSIALVATGALVRLVGVRRARVGLQIFSAVVGASFYLVSQVQQLVPPGVKLTVGRWLFAAAAEDSPSWAMRAPAALVGGDAVAWAIFVIGSVAIFAGSVRAARPRFLEVARTAEAEGPVVAAPRAAVARRIAAGFKHGVFATLLVKEWRLLLRAPQLISQILLQLLYLVPLLFVAFGRHDATAGWSAAAFVAGIVGVAATLASSLAWLTVSAEDAPDLIAGSPRGRLQILLAKLAAGALPPVAIVVVAAIGTARRSVRDAACIAGFGVLACAAAAVLATATSTPGRRSDYQRRHQGRGAAGVVEALQFLLWAGAAGAVVAGYAITAVVATSAALAVTGFFVPRALRRFDDAAP